MKKIILKIFIVFFFSLIFLYSKPFDKHEKGSLKVRKKVYFYSLSSDFVVIKDIKGIPVFEKKVKNRENSIYLSTGFLKTENSFFVFKERISDSLYNLEIDFKDKSKELVKNSKIPFYTPIVFTYSNKTFFAYIDENFSILVRNFETSEIVSKLIFNTPIHSLEITDNKIRFFLFLHGSYKETTIKIDNLIFGKKILEEKHTPLRKKQVFMKFGNDFPNNLSSDIVLNYNKYLGFGDSITYGYINRHEAPDKGYIPRLQEIIDSQWYGGEVINEGVPGEVTADAVNRFEDVILKHRAKYLLFHEGTNDALFPNRFSVSMILYNIEYMMKTALKYNIIPILTTIIPRNGKWGIGIYRERSIEISNGIKKICSDYDISLIDFFEIFSNYPESEGGYDSLMSDTVHPSEKGYQLMAEEWFASLKNLPPDIPEIISYKNYVNNISKIIGIKINLKTESDPDFKQYNIYYGKTPDSLKNLYANKTDNSFFIILPPGVYYIGIKAEDNYGNESKISTIIKYKAYRLFF